jgi:hypothetical protein
MVPKAKVHSAKIPDQDGLKLLLGSARSGLSRLSHLWLDAGYGGRGKRWTEEVLGLSVEIVRHPPKPIPEEVARTWAAQWAPTDQDLQRGLLRAGTRGLLLRPTNGRRVEGARSRRLRTRPYEARPSAVQVARSQAHGGHEHGIPEEPSGSIEQPVSFGASPDGTAPVISLLEGVKANRLTSGAPEYILLHAVSSEDASELACGDLVVAGSRGSG